MTFVLSPTVKYPRLHLTVVIYPSGVSLFRAVLGPWLQAESYGNMAAGFNFGLPFCGLRQCTLA